MGEERCSSRNSIIVKSLEATFGGLSWVEGEELGGGVGGVDEIFPTACICEAVMQVATCCLANVTPDTT
jgi:hypothetical protein